MLNPQRDYADKKKSGINLLNLRNQWKMGLHDDGQALEIHQYLSNMMKKISASQDTRRISNECLSKRFAAVLK